MASTEPVHPLRISKNGPPTPASSGSPVKMASSIPRPLSELSPMEKRRNSPSWNQPSKKLNVGSDSSPFQSSPMDGTTSPRLFWQNRGFNENSLYTGTGSPSPTRRSSIERLQKASRVKNSNILALEHKQEYDPTRLPHIERPLAKVQGNAYGGRGINGLRSNDGEKKGHQRSESLTSIPLYSPSKPPQSMSTPAFSLPRTPGTKEAGSPVKSSLSTNKFKSSFDSQQGDGSAIDDSMDEPDLPSARSFHRHAKSVTFDAAPPQINEYEMATPDISSIGTNSREGSYESEEDDYEFENHYLAGEAIGQEDSFDASLEDTDKTPVVGPEDWRHDSPAAHTRGLLEDPFEGSPMPDALPPTTARPAHNRTDSTNSDHRPLPPLPPMELTRSHSSSSTSATAERMVGAQRNLPSPPPASATKSEIQNFGHGKMTLEERLKLMMLSDDGKSAADEQRERRMRRAGNRDRVGSGTPEAELPSLDAEEQQEMEDTIGDLSGLDEYQLPPRISRESILRRVNGNQGLARESDYNFSSPAPGSSPERQMLLDPDVPIPSTEDSMLDLSVMDQDGPEKEADMYSITDYYEQSGGSQQDEQEDAADDGINDNDSASHYSDTSKDPMADADLASTPRATTPVQEEPMPSPVKEIESFLPDLSAGSKKLDLGTGMETFLLPKPTETEAEIEEAPKMTDAQAYLQRPYTPEQQISKQMYDGSGWGEDDEFEDEEPSTPDSVIHHPMPEDSPPRESPAVPEQVATIKASGSKLKTRPSATPSDIMAMREARRQVSREVPDIPPIPERHRNRLSRDFDGDRELLEADDFLERHPSFKNRSLTLDIDLGLSLDKDFDRVIEAQKVADEQFSLPPPQKDPSTTSVSRQVSTKAGRSFNNKDLETTKNDIGTNITGRKQRGYLMRQNTKLVAASDKDTEDHRGTRSAGNSPLKKDRPQSWTVEPWNGNRRKSVKKANRLTGPVPPLPGQESNAAPLNTLAEEEPHVDVVSEDSGERGRLFIKVTGVKDLDLPIPKNERTWFSLTLDNGVHCVTTAWLELARNAPIGQEFELVVPNDLEFQLTLNVKLEKPAPARIPQSPAKASKPKTSTFSRVFASPRKRKEMEARQREEDERLAREQREAQARNSAQPTAWDLLSPLAAEDGSFARAYVCLKEHESRCFGRPYSVEVACFNEWATEEANFASSVKSKRGNTAVVRRAPYKIGKLELQLLFVPRPKGSADEDMPKSMNSCIREMRAAEERLSRNWEGHLSQQGGDCPYWRRRYFKLVGTKLTAYHEATRQPRATINLANAKRLIDDKRSLTEKETTGRNGQRRRSGFAEEEEGYMFVEEGFRIRFNNGEVIDFYADTAPDKEGWMRVLSEVIGRDSTGPGDDDGGRPRGKWCDLVIKREDTLRKRTEGRRVHSRTKSMLT